MPVQLSIDHPSENDVQLSPRFLELSTGHIHVTGTGNVLRIETPHIPGAANFTLTGGTRVVVDGECNLGSISVFALSPGVSIEIGAWTSFHGASIITAHEPARISIGAECLVGPDCTFSASDVHKVLDQHTRTRLNPAGDIVIGKHVWFAPRTTVLRNTTVGRECVVGVGSVLKGEYPDNSMVAGAPARVVRSGVTWEF